MIKPKKIMLSISLLGASLAPIAAISCGQLRYDQNYDGKIVLSSSFQPTGPQAIALQEILRVYNQTQKGTKDYLPVSLKFSGATYPQAARILENELKAKDAQETPNLIVGNTTVLASVAEYNMTLPLDDRDNKDGYGIDRNEYENDFININDKIGGLEKGGIYGLPISKSTLVTSINSPVLSYIFETMVSFGATVKPEDKAWFDSIINAGKGDLAYVKSLYGAPLESEKSTYANGKVVISRDIFKDSMSMLEFAKNAQQLFTNTHNNPTGDLHIMGIDDLTSFLAINVFSMTAKEKNDFSNYYFKFKKDGFIDYTGYGKEGSPAYESLSKIAKELIDVSKTGALYIANPPSYATTVIRKHRLAFAIGSTAGYNYNFFEGKSRPDSVFIKKTLDGKNVNVDITNVSNIAVLDKTESKTNEDVNYLTKTSNVTVYRSTEDPSKVKSSDIILKDEDTNNAVLNFIKSANSDASKSLKSLFIANSKRIDDFYKDQKGKMILQSAGIMYLGQTSKNMGIYGVIDANTLNTGKYENSQYFEFRVFSEAETLQRNELFGLPAPTKWDESDKINSVYVQGPLLVSIHANKKEDIATRKFTKWLSSATTLEAFKYRTPDNQMKYKQASGNLFTDDIREAKKETPYSYIFQQTSYFVPYKGVFDKDIVAPNPFLAIAIEQFKKSVKNTDNTWSLVEEPTDSLTTAFKSDFVTAWRTPLIAIANGNTKDLKGSYADDIKPRADTLLKGSVIV